MSKQSNILIQNCSLVSYSQKHPSFTLPLITGASLWQFDSKFHLKNEWLLVFLSLQTALRKVEAGSHWLFTDHAMHVGTQKWSHNLIGWLIESGCTSFKQSEEQKFFMSSFVLLLAREFVRVNTNLCSICFDIRW